MEASGWGREGGVRGRGGGKGMGEGGVRGSGGGWSERDGGGEWGREE